jgi:distribution and morphology protein 10
MTAMPTLSGSIGYIFTSCDLDVKTSGTVKFKNMLEHFRVYDQPRRPEGKEEEWLAGERVDTRGAFYPSALYSLFTEMVCRLFIIWEVLPTLSPP